MFTTPASRHSSASSFCSRSTTGTSVSSRCLVAAACVDTPAIAKHSSRTRNKTDSGTGDACLNATPLMMSKRTLSGPPKQLHNATPPSRPWSPMSAILATSAQQAGEAPPKRRPHSLPILTRRPRASVRRPDVLWNLLNVDWNSMARVVSSVACCALSTTCGCRGRRTRQSWSDTAAAVGEGRVHHSEPCLQRATTLRQRK